MFRDLDLEAFKETTTARRAQYLLIAAYFHEGEKPPEEMEIRVEYDAAGSIFVQGPGNLVCFGWWE